MKLAIIGGGRMAYIIASRAKEIGVETLGFSLESGVLSKEIFTHFYDINIFEEDKIVEICREQQIDGVVATTELTIVVAAYVADKLHLNGNPLAVSEVITDKNRNRQMSANVPGLNHPGFLKTDNVEDIANSALKYPLILKPISTGGKRGIMVVRNEEEMRSSFDATKSAANKSNPLVIVEEFIEGGTEYSVESLSFHGKHTVIQVTEKISSGAPHCVELGHQQPANLSPEMREKVETVLENALSSIGLVNGPCHTEIKIVDGKIYLIEFNARPGGDHIAFPLTELSTGYPYITGIIEAALDVLKPIDKKSFVTRYAGVYFVTAQTSHLKPIFDVCEQYDWCYHRNKVSDDLQTLEHNDCYGTNSIMYLSETGRIDINDYLNTDNMNQTTNYQYVIRGGLEDVSRLYLSLFDFSSSKACSSYY